jgi:hypothetical protein
MTYVKPAALIAAIASAALSSTLIAAPVAREPALSSADQLQHLAAAKKQKPAATLRCPPRFTAACKSGWRLVCTKRDSRGCCTKSVCRPPLQ